MSFIFWGTPDFAAIVLKNLLSNGFIPLAVVCNPDRPVGRKKILTPSAVKQEVQKNELKGGNTIHIFQPENPTREIASLTSLHPDLFIVAAYAKILPKEILSIPRLGTIGIHPSLLPKYRGATPIQTAILTGESETGVTLYLVDEKVDHGAIIANRKVQIANRNYEELEELLAETGGDLLVKTLSRFSESMVAPEPQDESRATYTKKFTADDGFVPPELLEKAENEGDVSAFEIERKIRALNPEPGIYTMRDGKRIKLLKGHIENGKLKLAAIQKEGKKTELLI